MHEEYENKYVVFIDILGFKDLIAKKSSSEISEILDYFLPINLEEFIKHSFASEEIANEEFDFTNLRITNFSDCLVISFGDTECPSMNEITAYNVIEAIANISMVLVRDHEVHLRGGMTFGKIHHSETKVYGPALNRAYEIESKFSEYPRFLIKDLDLPDIGALGLEKIHELIKETTVKNDKFLELNIANSIYYTKVTRDSFNDYIRSFRDKNNLSTDSELKKVKSSCKKLLSEIEKDPSFYQKESLLKVWKKHKWIADKLDSLDL